MFAPAWEIRQPAVAAFAPEGERFVAVEAKGVSLSRKGVRVTAFCPNPDGAGIVFRAWERTGVGGKITATLLDGLGVTSAQPVNLRGEPEGGTVAV